jgi:hypothetical protein
MKSFDQFVRENLERWRNRQPDRPGGPKIDYKLKPDRELHWQLARKRST